MSKSQLNKVLNYNNNGLKHSNAGFNSFIRCILPPLPDVRRVVLNSTESMLLPEWMQVDVPLEPAEFGVPSTGRQRLQVQATAGQAGLCSTRPEISSANTMIIGTYITASLPVHDKHWLVQARGNATFHSTMQEIKGGVITVDRKYIFIELGANQVRSASAEMVEKWILDLVVTIRDLNKHCRMYFVGVLLRPVENEEIKPYIMKFNRWLTTAVNRMQALMGKIQMVPVHLRYLGTSGPRLHLFNQDGLTLNEAGAKLFRASLFQSAGFVQNK